MESELLHKQNAILEEELAAAKQAGPDLQSMADSTPSLAKLDSSDFNLEQQLRILMTCASTAERRVKQLDEELARVCSHSQQCDLAPLNKLTQSYLSRGPHLTAGLE